MVIFVVPACNTIAYLGKYSRIFLNRQDVCR